MFYPHNQVYNVILKFHFVLVIFLNLTYTFVSQTAHFLGNRHFLGNYSFLLQNYKLYQKNLFNNQKIVQL